MIITNKKKLTEKITEALERAEHERWLLDRIATIERECREMVDGVHRRLHEIEMKLEKHDGT